jgi:hypothetical protein
MIDKNMFLKFNFNSISDLSEIETLVTQKKVSRDYLELLKLGNGGEGFIGNEYLILYKNEDLVKINNQYEIEKYVPGIFIFGSNGGDEALAFDYRNDKIKYILIPFMFEYDTIIELGKTIEEFLDRIYQNGFFI